MRRGHGRTLLRDLGRPLPRETGQLLGPARLRWGQLPPTDTLSRQKQLTPAILGLEASKAVDVTETKWKVDARAGAGVGAVLEGGQFRFRERTKVWRGLPPVCVRVTAALRADHWFGREACAVFYHNKANLGSVFLSFRGGGWEELAVPTRLGHSPTHLPHSHVPDLGRDRALQEQGAAPVPGVRQAAVHLHPALLPLSKQGLDLLGPWVVPGPHRLLLEGEQSHHRPLHRPRGPSCPSQGRPQDVEKRQPLCHDVAHSGAPLPPGAGPTHLTVADSPSPHAQAERSDKGQGADAVGGQITCQQTPEPAEKCTETAAQDQSTGAPAPRNSVLVTQGCPLQSGCSSPNTDMQEAHVCGQSGLQGPLLP